MKLTTKQKLKKIMNDFPLFCKNFIEIIDNDGNKVKLNLNKAQDELFDLLKNNRYIACNKARQCGISTEMLAYGLWRALKNDNQNILIVSYKQDSSNALFTKLKFMNDWLPRDKYPDLFSKVRRDNRGELLFENGSRVTCAVAGNGASDIGRGSSYNYCHITEASFFHDFDRQLLSLEQSLLKGADSRITIETTANGMNAWYKLFKKAMKGESKYKAFFVPFYHDLYKEQFRYEHDLAEQWHKEAYGRRLQAKDLEDDEIPIYQKCNNLRFIMWRRFKLLDIELQQFHQEYPSTYLESFVNSAATIFDNQKVLERIDHVLIPLPKKHIIDKIPKDLQKYIGKELLIYHLPKGGAKYYGGVDSATGGKNDYSTISIYNEHGEEVASFGSNKIPVYLFAPIINALGRFYSYAFLCIERNNVGITVIERLRKEYIYLNLYKQKLFDQKGKFRPQLGWTTTAINKSILIQDFKESFETGNILIHTKETLEQMQIFIERDNGSTGNKGGSNNHDDFIISNALAVQALKTGKYYV
ncbi:terminase large subunit domain-containing protein [Terrilactibacillus tamarindi]|nr:terminase family protein [Terrilactibacillus tamarindi]